MPRKGRRSEAAKLRWKKMDLGTDVTMPRTSPTAEWEWSPTQSPVKKMTRLLESVPPDQEEPRRPYTRLGSRRGTGWRHRAQRWPFSRVTRRTRKLKLPKREAPEKKFALLVGDSHLRAIVDGYVTFPEGNFSLAVLASPGASADELRHEVLDVSLPRYPEVVCLLAPSNNLTASSTCEAAGRDFNRLLSTISELCANVVVLDFPPRLNVDENQQHLLRQEFARVAALRSVRYIPVADRFPMSRLDLWSRDGIHLSDHPGMDVLAQLLQEAICSQLQASVQTSPAPTSTSRCVLASRPASVVADGHLRVVDEQGDLLERSIPPNPVWFSPSLLKEMARISPASGGDTALPRPSPGGKKASARRRRPRPDPSQLRVEERQEKGSRQTTRRQAGRQSPTMDVPADPPPHPMEDHIRDGSWQAPVLEPYISGPPVLTVRATHCQADNRRCTWTSPPVFVSLSCPQTQPVEADGCLS